MNPIGQSNTRFNWQTDKYVNTGKGITGTMKDYKSVKNISIGWDGLNFVNREKNNETKHVDSLKK
jgi:hypothetical protein